MVALVASVAVRLVVVAIVVVVVVMGEKVVVVVVVVEVVRWERHHSRNSLQSCKNYRQSTSCLARWISCIARDC